MGRVKNILIGEGNRLIALVYREVIERLFVEEFDLFPKLFVGHSCDACLRFLEQHNLEIQLVLIDYELEASRNKRFLNGLDLAKYIRFVFPGSKIIFLLTKMNVFLIKTLIHEVDPQGILEKRKLTIEILFESIQVIWNGGIYYDKEIKEKRIYFLHSEYFPDEWDRRILYELSLGTNRTQLAEELPFSISTIARRKRRLKDYFGVSGMGDRMLVKKAREMGFL